MKRSNMCWPWRYAAATGYSSQTHHSTPDNLSTRNYYETRWHGNRSASFGVRRPLRYLGYTLDLDENQMRRMASVLNQLKTEREQAKVDEKRSISAVADLLENGTPSLDDIRQALSARVKSAEVLREESAKALVAVSSFLDDDQRQEFAQLLLTGSVSF